jgi:hypothetical protein
MLIVAIIPSVAISLISAIAPLGEAPIFAYLACLGLALVLPVIVRSRYEAVKQTSLSVIILINLFSVGLYIAALFLDFAYFARPVVHALTYSQCAKRAMTASYGFALCEQARIFPEFNVAIVYDSNSFLKQSCERLPQPWFQVVDKLMGGFLQAEQRPQHLYHRFYVIRGSYNGNQKDLSQSITHCRILPA